MGKISELPDDLLVQILSLVPTKTVFDAQVVSKRWRNLWRRLVRLNYDSASHESETQFHLFINTTMELLESPVLERFYVKTAPLKTRSNVVLRSDLFTKRPMRELELVSNNPVLTVLERGIYQHQTLVILRLEGFSLEDNYGNPISLRSLKVLQLIGVKYSSDKSLSNLLSSLPSLEDLTLVRCFSGRTTTLAIAVPCLKRLTVVTCPVSCQTSFMMLNVNTPSLNYLNVEDYWRTVSFVDQKMENLIEADVNVTFIDTEKLLKSLISAKRLSLCLVISKILPSSVFFDQLVRLEIHVKKNGGIFLRESCCTRLNYAFSSFIKNISYYYYLRFG